MCDLFPMLFQVIMDSQATNVYQLVKEKTKNLSVRTLMLTEALSSKMQSGDQKQRGLAY